MNARAQRAKQIMETQGHCSQIDANTFSIRSQSDPEKRYAVRVTAGGLVCVMSRSQIQKGRLQAHQNCTRDSEEQQVQKEQHISHYGKSTAQTMQVL